MAAKIQLQKYSGDCCLCDKAEYSKSMMSTTATLDDSLLQKVTQKVLQLCTFGIIPNGWYDVWTTTNRVTY
jgi:hypothetical protein